MSGHSHWENVKNKKGKEDLRRGKLFTRLSLQIITAVREGGDDPNFNPPLRAAITEAKKANMPWGNIERAISRGVGGAGSGLCEQVLEGYGPHGVAFLVYAQTDNKNRTLGFVRNIFERAGGSLGSVGSSSYVFSGGGPQFVIELGGEQAESVRDLIARLNELPDVTKVLTNAKFS